MLPIRIPEAESLFDEYKSLKKLLKFIKEKEELTIRISKDKTSITIENKLFMELKNLNYEKIILIANEQLHTCEEKIKKL